MQNMAATAAKSMTLESSPRASIVAADVDSKTQLRPPPLTVISTKGRNLLFLLPVEKQISLFGRNDNFFGAIDELDGGLHSL